MLSPTRSAMTFAVGFVSPSFEVLWIPSSAPPPQFSCVVVVFTCSQMRRGAKLTVLVAPIGMTTSGRKVRLAIETKEMSKPQLVLGGIVVLTLGS